MSVTTSNKMSKEQIINAAADISNSLYRLWMDNDLTNDDYERLRGKMLDFYRDGCWTILLEKNP